MTSQMHFLRFACFFYLLAMVTGSRADAQNNKGKLNVLFIAVDDMNDWISPLGGLKGIKTPNLERLAKMSMTFTNAHCASPACAPSRTSLMTGGTSCQVRNHAERLV